MGHTQKRPNTTCRTIKVQPWETRQKTIIDFDDYGNPIFEGESQFRVSA